MISLTVSMNLVKVYQFLHCLKRLVQAFFFGSPNYLAMSSIHHACEVPGGCGATAPSKKPSVSLTELLNEGLSFSLMSRRSWAKIIICIGAFEKGHVGTHRKENLLHGFPPASVDHVKWWGCKCGECLVILNDILRHIFNTPWHHPNVLIWTASIKGFF